jgi:inner membrane protein
MSPITHFLASWTIAESCTQNRRERFWICLAGLAPDLDGLGLAVDVFNDLFGRGVSQWYAVYHHFLFHGLFGALVIVATARAVGVSRFKGLLLVFLSFHLHLLCDLVGARGPAIYDIWVIYYFGPFTRAFKFYWMPQWPLNGWPNFLITIALLGWTLSRAINRGASPVSLFSVKLDAVIVATLRQRWGWLSGSDTNKAQRVAREV